MSGFPLASPDLVNCGGSPSYGDSPDIAQKLRFSTELSLENGIARRRKSQSVKFSAINQTFGFELSPASSFELPYRESTTTPVISVNSGSTTVDVTVDDVTFSKDEFFGGGETFVTDAVVGSNEDETLLYQTARLGNFAYKFQSLVPGDYFIDLHFAEIEFTKGPAGVRVFDIFIQEAKARLIINPCIDCFSLCSYFIACLI